MRSLPAFVVALATTPALLLGSAPAAHGQASNDLRARRAALLARIADLNDRSEQAEATVVRSQLGAQTARHRLFEARQVAGQRAIVAYVEGVNRTFAALSATTLELELAFRDDRRVVAGLHAAKQVAEQGRANAEQARDVARAAEGDLEKARGALEATIAREEQVRLDAEARLAVTARRSALARAARSAAHESPAVGRHRRATEAQGALMARYPFGPVAALPAGLVATGQHVVGTASWYGPGFDGQATASGAVYDQEGWTCASRDLPFGTMLLVGHAGRQVLLLVNDRGPYVADRVLDLSHAAAQALGMHLGPVDAQIVVAG